MQTSSTVHRYKIHQNTRDSIPEKIDGSLKEQIESCWKRLRLWDIDKWRRLRL